jgi:nucleoside-diphosphate-sugar epimerase
MKPSVSILGCGWLGFPLAQYLTSQGYRIKGSTTTPGKLKVLHSSGIESFLIRLSETHSDGHISQFLESSETLIIAIPPGLRQNPTKNHLAEIQLLLPYILDSQLKHVLYISSISVFKDKSEYPVISDSTEPNANTSSARQIIAIEQLLKTTTTFKTTIIRFGGLFDAQRHPAKFLSGKTEIKNPKAPINLIHKTDCIQIIFRCLNGNHWGKTLNAVYPWHPEKEQYYTNYCIKAGIPVPHFDSKTMSHGKKINSLGLERLLGYKFQMTP